MNPTKQLGNAGEELVAQWLEKNGIRVLAKNYQTRWGEIDLIAAKGEVVAFIEVKTRKTEYFPTSMVITRSKQLKLIKTAKHFVLQHNIIDRVLRFDIATITKTETSYKINYIPNAFPGG